jgi:hypothetical protein
MCVYVLVRITYAMDVCMYHVCVWTVCDHVGIMFPCMYVCVYQPRIGTVGARDKPAWRIWETVTHVDGWPQPVEYGAN